MSIIIIFTLHSYYSNLAYALLGRCLVQKYNPGMTYEEYVNKNILQPLELNDTGFNITDR